MLDWDFKEERVDWEEYVRVILDSVGLVDWFGEIECCGNI